MKALGVTEANDNSAVSIEQLDQLGQVSQRAEQAIDLVATTTSIKPGSDNISKETLQGRALHQSARTSSSSS